LVKSKNKQKQRNNFFKMGNFCGIVAENDIYTFWTNYSLLVEEKSADYIELMELENLDELDFEKQQIVISALVLGIKLSLIWETVYEQLVIPKLAVNPMSKHYNQDSFQIYEQDMAQIKNIFEGYLNKETKPEDSQNILKTAKYMLKKFKSFNEVRRQQMSPENMMHLSRAVQGNLYKNVTERINILKMCQSVSLKEYSKISHLKSDSADCSFVDF
jgi:hypothetical protein